jgi:hypothetical protein
LKARLEYIRKKSNGNLILEIEVLEKIENPELIAKSFIAANFADEGIGFFTVHGLTTEVKIYNVNEVVYAKFNLEVKKEVDISVLIQSVNFTPDLQEIDTGKWHLGYRFDLKITPLPKEYQYRLELYKEIYAIYDELSPQFELSVDELDALLKEKFCMESKSSASIEQLERYRDCLRTIEKGTSIEYDCDYEDAPIPY